MCGRYASARSVDELTATFGVDGGGVESTAAPDWNVAPTKPVTAVLVRDGRRVLTTLRWGLVPSWADRPTSRLINARMETAAQRPAYRAALSGRRCLLPADGWYEWVASPNGTGHPHYLHRADGGLLAFAAVWEVWRDGEGRVLATTAILTGPAPDDLAHLHDRAPVVLGPDVWADWLDPSRSHAGDLLRPTPTSLVVAHPVGPAVGDVRASGPALTERVEAAEQQPLF